MPGIPPESLLRVLVAPVIQKLKPYDENPLETALRVVATFPFARWEVNSNHLPLMVARIVLYIFETPALQPAALAGLNSNENGNGHEKNRYQPGNDFTHVLAVALLTASFGAQPFNGGQSVRLAVSLAAGLMSAISCTDPRGKFIAIVRDSSMRSYVYTIAVLTIATLCSTDLFDVLELGVKATRSFLGHMLNFFLYTRKFNTSGTPKSSFAKEARKYTASFDMPSVPTPVKEILLSSAIHARDLFVYSVNFVNPIPSEMADLEYNGSYNNGPSTFTNIANMFKTSSENYSDRDSDRGQGQAKGEYRGRKSSKRRKKNERSRSRITSRNNSSLSTSSEEQYSNRHQQLGPDDVEIDITSGQSRSKKVRGKKRTQGRKSKHQNNKPRFRPGLYRGTK